MKYGVYSIRDIRTGFLNLAIDVNNSSAERNFRHACKDTNSLMHSHSSDYALFKVAEFDNETGIIEEICPIELVVSADQFKREE